MRMVKTEAENLETTYGRLQDDGCVGQGSAQFSRSLPPPPPIEKNRGAPNRQSLALGQALLGLEGRLARMILAAGAAFCAYDPSYGTSEIHCGEKTQHAQRRWSFRCGLGCGHCASRGALSTFGVPFANVHAANAGPEHQTWMYDIHAIEATHRRHEKNQAPACVLDRNGNLRDVLP